MSLTKYEQLKRHALHDYPSLIWNEEQAEDDDSYTYFNNSTEPSSRPTSINIQYVDPKHKPFATSVHELGHYLSILAGFHTPELEDIGNRFRFYARRGVRVRAPEVLEEEERAWKLGAKFAAKYGLILTAKDLLVKKEDLNSYRRGMGLPLL
jgi:hypothetical protein